MFCMNGSPGYLTDEELSFAIHGTDLATDNLDDLNDKTLSANDVNIRFRQEYIFKISTCNRTSLGGRPPLVSIPMLPELCPFTELY